jgi:muconate/chloromuconate cycloisomerase
MKIKTIESAILDIPLTRPHHLSFGVKTAVNVVIVRVTTEDGSVGTGEAVASAGPSWGEECAETIKLIIDKYAAPELIGQDASNIVTINRRMARRIRGNYFAKAAVEMACYDLLGRALKVPICTLLGGRYQERLALSWSLAIGDVEAELAEARRLIDRGHFIFKIKVGELQPDEDEVRVRRLAKELGGKARLRVDANQAWNEMQSTLMIPVMEDIGIEFVEQPVPRWNLDALARLTARFDIPIMADEAACTQEDASRVVTHAAADILALKLTKAGGFAASRNMAAIAEAAGLPCYIGCFTETGIGTAAYTHFGAATPQVTMGCELFGPLLISEDIIKTKIRYQDGYVYLPDGPGLGVELDEAKVERFLRKV